MTRIIIDGVETPQDLYDALAKVTHVFKNSSKFASSEETFYKRGARPDYLDQADQADRADDAVEQAEKEQPEPVRPLVPCPDRGTHLRLSDCWACFCDVQRGACLEVDVVAEEAWDVALRRLAEVPATPADLVDAEGAERADKAAAESEQGEWLMLPFARSGREDESGRS